MNHNAAKSNLAERLIPIRASMREQNRILRRARHLYIFLARNDIVTTEALKICARRMKEAGLYADATGDKDVRFSILRHKWKIETGGKDWHRWARSTGWYFGTWTKAEATA